MGNCLTISANDGYGGSREWDGHPEHANWIEVHELGHGNFSKVVLAKHAYEKGRVAALKIVFVNDPLLDEETKALLVQEGNLLFELSHPNLVNCRQIYPSKEGVLVYELEYLRGMNLLEGIYVMRNTYSERDAARIFKQIVEAVGYLHENGVIHRDIKPENVVFQNMLKGGISVQQYYKAPVVKLLDLGLAWKMDGGSIEGINGAGRDGDGGELRVSVSGDTGFISRKTSEAMTDMTWTTVSGVETGCIGSPGFIAPEVVFDKPHTPAMDVYGLGVLLFIMLVGRKPYDSNLTESLEYATIPIKEAQGLKDPRWLDLSPDAKHLILGMLREDPKRRMNCTQILQHEWITSEGGLTLRHLGEDIAMGAATVGEMRRLRHLDRAISSSMDSSVTSHAVDASRSRSGRRRAVNPGSKDKYLAAFDRSVRRERSAHGGSAIENMARSITAKSYSIAHDAGRSVHGRTLERSVHERSFHGNRNFEDGANDMLKKRPSTGMSGHGLRQLGKAVSGYIEERSVHGRRTSSRETETQLDDLDLSSRSNPHGFLAAQEMNERWRSSLDGSGSRGRTVNAVKPYPQ